MYFLLRISSSEGNLLIKVLVIRHSPLVSFGEHGDELSDFIKVRTSDHLGNYQLLKEPN
jgi:hypothetical protein